MSKPGKYPWNDKYQEFWLFETVKNRFKLSVLGHYKIQNDFAQDNSDMADIELEKVMEVDFAGFFHHVVANVVSEYGEKYWGDVMEALDIPEFRVMAEEIIKDHEYVVLALFPLSQKILQMYLVDVFKSFHRGQWSFSIFL